MELPHLRPAYGVNAPAIFRHIGFRIATQTGDPLRATDFDESVRLRNQFVSNINKILQKLQVAFGVNTTPTFEKYGNTPRDGALSPLKTLLTEFKIGRPENIDTDLSSWRIRVRVDIHTEYYSVTFILDQHSDSDNGQITGGAKRACEYEKRLSEASQPWTPEDISDAGDFFYDNMWAALDKFIGADLEFPGLRFAEFRSFVLRDLNSCFHALKAKPGRFPFAITDHDQFLSCRTSLLTWLNNNAELVRGILKFNQLTKEIDQDANCVLCEVLDGNAIYGSSLGQYPRKWAASEPSATNQQLTFPAPPLRYFIIYNDLSKYQIGRLIRRTHVLGELRFATVFDMALLATASAKIRALGNYIDRLTSSLPAQSGNSLAEAELQYVQRKLDEISSSNISGGLTYRVARSRYYADGFTLFLAEMRVKRIEQWEPYDNFVRRRLFHVFRFISDVGTRYQALAFRVHRLTTTYNAQRLNQFQDNVSSLVRQMARTNDEIRDIQVLGEAIGIAAFAYYGGHIIASFAMAIMKARCFQLGIAPLECKEMADRYIEVIDVASVILALVLLRPLWNFWRRFRGVITSAERHQSTSNVADRSSTSHRE